MKKFIFYLFMIGNMLMTNLTFAAAAQEHNLVNIRSVDPTIMTDIAYATENNFTHKEIYPSAGCFVHKDLIAPLQSIQKELRAQGLGLKIWDAYRPLSAQKKLFEVVSNPIFVCDPGTDGRQTRHTRGTTVDVTLVSLADGQELEMPTPFDDFSDAAAFDYKGASPAAEKNRELLKEIMIRHGFETVKSEWWHFDYNGWRKYPVLDSSFAEIENNI